MSFHLANSFLCCAKAFKFNQVPLVYFWFYFCYSRRWVRGSCFDLCQSVLPMFSSKSFIVSGITFRSVMHLEFIFVYGVRKCSNFILLHVAVQFSKHHLLKRLFFPYCVFLPPLSKIKVSVSAWVYFWAFYLIPLVYIFVFVPVLSYLDNCSFVVQSEVRKVDSSSSILLSQDCFGYSGSFVCPYEL